MMLTKGSRAKDLDRQLAVWEPLIGRRATETALRGRWWGQFGFFVILIWVATYIALDASGSPGVAQGIAAGIAWPVILASLVIYVRLSIHAQREAGLVAGTAPKARPPVNSVSAFNRWRSTSKYSRAAAGETHNALPK